MKAQIGPATYAICFIVGLCSGTGTLIQNAEYGRLEAEKSLAQYMVLRKEFDEHTATQTVRTRHFIMRDFTRTDDECIDVYDRVPFGSIDYVVDRKLEAHPRAPTKLEVAVFNAGLRDAKTWPCGAISDKP